MSYKSFLPRCVICKQAVKLTESKADEYGQAVHEDCYVSMLVSKQVDTQEGYDLPSRRPAKAVSHQPQRRTDPGYSTTSSD